MSLLSTTESIPNKGQPLEEAFHAFNQISQHLTDSYQQLEEQVVVLSQQLADANSEKIQYLSEKEALAQQLEAMVETLPGAVIVLDNRRIVVKVNACAREWFQHDMIGHAWTEIKAKALINIESIDGQFKLLSGEVVALSATRLNGQSAEIVLLTDISHQQALQQRVEQQKRLAEMGKLSASLAHQIRTPLATALLYASQLNSASITAQSQQKFSAKILQQLRLLSSQVTDMLNYAHQGEFIKKSVKLSDFINRIEQSYQEKAVDFIPVSDQEKRLIISEDALSGAIANLIDNALDAINADGRIVCDFKLLAKQGLVISIKDEGIGLSAEQQKRIFDPFYTNKMNGTGLGLAVVKQVVDAHSGRVVCVSEVGLGTTMTLTLPVIAPPLNQQTIRSV
ncbi:MAG: two-component sensor histidine kinase [Cycloclasticus sp.]|nr:two-component sensor histidine kinase [Cycloclasticus sp.]MBQ0789664.1 two-component sensor histidine kinase [Cycloclasticus sp.]